jgi:ribosomal protein L37AE/L43A
MKKTKVKKIIESMKSSYACRGCLKMTNKVYQIRGVNVLACCPDCARKFIKDLK